MYAERASETSLILAAAKLGSLGTEAIQAVLASVAAVGSEAFWRLECEERPFALAKVPAGTLLAGWHSSGVQQATYTWTIPNIVEEVRLAPGNRLESPLFGPSGQGRLVAYSTEPDVHTIRVDVEWRPPQPAANAQPPLSSAWWARGRRALAVARERIGHSSPTRPCAAFPNPASVS